MCAENRHEGVSSRVGHPMVYLDQDGVEGRATWWGHVRSETISQVLGGNPHVSWKPVDIPSDSFTERARDTDRREVEFPVPEGMVIAGALVTRKEPGSPDKVGLNIITRAITQEEVAYSARQGVLAPNPRMPMARTPLKRSQ